MSKFLLELFERVVRAAQRSPSPEDLKKLEKLSEELATLAKDPSNIAQDQLSVIASKLDEIDPPNPANRPQTKSANMTDSAERSIQFVAEKTGLSFEKARLAIVEKMNEAYEFGNPKRTMVDDMDRIKAYLDNNLSIGSSSDALEFLDDIEELGSGIVDDSVDAIKNISKPVDDFDDGKSYSSFEEMQRDRKVGRYAEKPEDVSNYDELVEAGIYEPGTMNPGPNHPDVKAGIIEGSFEEMSNPLMDMLDTEIKISKSTADEIAKMGAEINDLMDQGRFSDARVVAERLKDFQNKLKAGDVDATIIPPNRTLNAAGGRIGFEDGSDDLPNKKPAERFFGEDAAKKGFPMGRRAFLGGLGAGIASLFIPRGAAKVATTAAKAAPEIAAQGMPSWFPLLVNKIKSQGKQIKVATGGRNPQNVYKIKDGNTEYILTEDAINGTMDVFTRGDDFQQVSFEYIPPTEMRRPDGKAFTEDAEFYASEFMKGGDDIPDYENTLGGIEDLKLGINSIEEFATKGSKTPAEKLDEIADEFKRATTKEDTSGFANGGRVGYKNGGGLGTLFKETRI
jgi:hypothetical protein